MYKAPYLPRISASVEAAVQDISNFVRLNEVAPDQYEEAGFGASANVFRGSYTRNGEVVKVAVKCVRPKSTDESQEVSKEKISKKVSRELGIWHSLNGGHNIVELLGIFTGIKSIPSFVCELCPWNLEEYLERKSPLPKHAKMSNILVTSDETAKLCDFGRSQKSGDPKVEVSHSSAFAGTIRYMSPELFNPDIIGPTPAADMWSYGCVALEVMCRVPPYHETTNDLEVVKLITNGSPPGNRPSGPRASLVNDTLWSALSACWKVQENRPTSKEFLDQLLSMVEKGEIPSPPVLSHSPPDPQGDPIGEWPEEVPDLTDHLEIEEGIGTIASSVRANVWLAALTIRKMVKGRFGVRHKNIVDLIGIDSSFEPHAGLVLEYCGSGNLVSYFKANYINRDEYKRPPSPIVNAYSVVCTILRTLEYIGEIYLVDSQMCDILDGLRYMHNYPIPIPQGDLTPENVLITLDGTAKICLFSFSRALAALPPSLGLTAPTGLLLPFRWMSPELLANNDQPTTESDMWAIGCVCYWILTGLIPYSSYREDFAGIETLSGQPPGTLANVYYGLGWITNGIWRIIGRCWNPEPLQRPSALEFSTLLKALERNKIDWLPVEVEDLAGKVKVAGFEAPLIKCIAVWREFHWEKQKHEADITLEMAVYQSTYVPNWYSRTIPVAIKVVGDGPIDDKARALIASIRNEITIMSQLDHDHIVKLLGIDSSHDQGPAMIFEFALGNTLDKFLSQSLPDFRDGIKLISCISSALRYLHEHENSTIVHGDIQPANILVLPNGQAKLTNFTCAFQYVNGQPTVGKPLSSTISTPLLPSLYFEPQSYEKPPDSLRLPTTTGDIWSLGSIMLSIFAGTFRFQRPDIYSTQIRQGASPCDLHGLSAGSHQVSSLIRSMLTYEPSKRPSAALVLDSLPVIG
ncbi:unnamed protein product [Rhizoctonia solani]|uniref:Protein kinase domain-containing protein n=1 Tax=Rhizoctonia solani TaxID=456999 RepID=A0A8H2WU26_9AGAM|nr:unnamed protein product [Rhizoctonia solani]